MSEVFLRFFPASISEKKAFSLYLGGLNNQDVGNFAEALKDYFKALEYEEDIYDRSLILYNIALIYTKIGKYLKALKYYYLVIFINPEFPSSFNNIGAIYHYQGVKAYKKKLKNLSMSLFKRSKFYLYKAVRLAPDNYIEAFNWLKTSAYIDV